MDDEQERLHRQAARMAMLASLARPVQHEINNLLTVVFANLEMLKRSAAEGAPQRQLDRIQEASRRIETSSRALLALVRRPVPDLVELTLTEVVTALRPLLQVLLQAPGALTLDPEPDAWPVRLDRALLDETLLRMVAELVDAVPRGTGLTLRVTNQPGREGRPDMAELVMHLPVAASPAVREALQRVARGGCGTLTEAEEGTVLLLALPRQPPAAEAPPGAPA